jgi:hypothetical protein
MNVLEFLTQNFSKHCHFSGSTVGDSTVAVVALVKYKKWVELSWLPDESQYLSTYPLPCTISWTFQIWPQIPNRNCSNEEEISPQPWQAGTVKEVRAKPK